MIKTYKNLQLEIDEEVIKMLKNQKKLQRKSMAKIVEDLIIEKYATPQEKLKRL